MKKIALLLAFMVTLCTKWICSYQSHTDHPPNMLAIASAVRTRFDEGLICEGTSITSAGSNAIFMARLDK